MLASRHINILSKVYIYALDFLVEDSEPIGPVDKAYFDVRAGPLRSTGPTIVQCKIHARSYEEQKFKIYMLRTDSPFPLHYKKMIEKRETSGLIT
jgi:hypothetical protein